MTRAATQHFGPEFGRELPLHLPICGDSCAEERYELLGIVAPIHVDSKQTTVLAADVASPALQLSLFMVAGRSVTSYECQFVGQKRYNAV